MLTFVETNARGLPVGASHHWMKWPRSIVDRAIDLRTAGVQLKAISEALGVPITTVHDWCAKKRRKLPDRVIVKRVKQPDSFGTNHQRSVTTNIDQPRFSDETGKSGEDPILALPAKIPSRESD